MKKVAKRLLLCMLVLGLAGSMIGCGSKKAEVSDNIVNVGVTSTLGSLNPFVIDQTEINVHAVGLMFLPLVSLNNNMEFEPMLADSITTEDNIHFVVHIDEDATWSDGKPVTAEDVEFTFVRLASPVINNVTMMYYAFEGVSDEGFVEEGADSVSGVQVLDEKTVQFTSKAPMSLTSFNNTYARYLRVLPKHVLAQYTEEELMTLEWFNTPDVVSGPYMATAHDPNHYIEYTANANFWMGAPKIEKLNIKIMDASQIYAGLKSGEIDITHHTMTAIPQTDYASIEKLDNVKILYGEPVTNQSVFVQTANLTDAKVRQALVYAIDREKILTDMLDGHGEIVDGFISSASPYFDDQIVPLEYNPEKAKQLLADAGWDSSKVLQFYVDSGDAAMVNAVQVMIAQWKEVGIEVAVKTVDLANLMSVAGTTDYDMLAVQYTYAPVDPYPDVQWLLSGEGSWTGYSSDEINAALAAVQLAPDTAAVTEQYSAIDQIVQKEVPMFSAYVISAQGAVNNRLQNAEPTVYGFFNNVHEWEIAK